MFTFNKNKLISTIFAFAVMGLFWVLPPVAPITAMGMKVIGVFLGTVLLISLVDTVWPSLLCVPLFALTGVMSINDAIIGSLGSWVTAFVIMSFILTYALNETGFTARLTAWFMTRKFVNKSPWTFTVSLITLGLIVGLFLDPVPTTAFFMMFSNRIFKELGYKTTDRYPHMVTMALAFSINIAGGMTPISHPLAILGMGIYQNAMKQSISLLTYMMYGVPTGLIIFAGLLIVLRIFFKPDMSKFANFNVRNVLEEVKPMSLKEKITVAAFFSVVILWMLPGVLTILMPGTGVAAFLNKMGPTFPAMIAVVLLALIEVDGQPVLNLKDAFTKGMSWGVIFLVGAAVLLGGAVTKESVGLTKFIVDNIVPVAKVLPTYMIVLLIVGLASVMTNFSSNVTTVVLMTGVGISIATGIDNVNVFGIALATTFTGALAYMVPASFASIAVLYGNEYSHGNTIFKYGAITVAITTLVVTFIGYPLALLLQ
jgi:solute carrier family 13 (sodium-dependent dicarboxylate transporter), member 2/3/5